MPATFQSGQDVFFRYVFYSGSVIIAGFVAVYHPDDSVLGLAKPTFLEIVQYGLYPCLWASDEASICDSDGKRTPKQSTQMRCRVCELVFLIASIREVDEDAQIVRARCDPDACASEFGAQLVEPTSCDAFDGAVNVEGRDGRMM